jgi:hypothetical protein
MKKDCATKTRLALEWRDAAEACGRIATSLVDNRDTLSLDESQSLSAKLDIVRELSEKLRKDLDAHLMTHGCADDCYRQIAKLLDDLREKHNVLAELFDSLPDPAYAAGDQVLAESERSAAEACAQVAASIRTRLKKPSSRR